jgi:hypothetical protein
MEKIFLPDRCRKMAKAGCVCVSFGMESGNQRILDLIDKGTKIQYMGETMKNFSEAGIPVQLMAFKDFPTETEAEKEDTLQFVKSHRKYWSTGGIGTFILTGTALVARNPEKFGIKLLETNNVDISRALAYRMEGETGRKLLSTEEYDASFDDTGDMFPAVLNRPWAGGTDSLHSMIYYEKYGRTCFKGHDLTAPSVVGRQAGPDLLECRLRVSSRLARSQFNINQILANQRTLKRHVKELIQVPTEPTYAELLQWQGSVPLVGQSDNQDTYWIATEKRCMKLDELAYRVVSGITGQTVTLKEVLADFDGDVRERLLVYFEVLAEGGLVELFLPDAPDAKVPARESTTITIAA